MKTKNSNRVAIKSSPVHKATATLKKLVRLNKLLTSTIVQLIKNTDTIQLRQTKMTKDVENLLVDNSSPQPNNNIQCGYTDKYLHQNQQKMQVYRRDWYCKDTIFQQDNPPHLPIPCPHLRLLPAFYNENGINLENSKLYVNYTEKLNIDPDFCTSVDLSIDNQHVGKRFYCKSEFDSATGRNTCYLFPCKHLAPSGLYTPDSPPLNSPLLSPSNPLNFLKLNPLNCEISPSQNWDST